MRIEIDIPKEFEEHFKQDKFKDSFERIMVDIFHPSENGDCLCADRYEYETIEMLEEAFENSKSAYNVDKVVDELELHSFELGADTLPVHYVRLNEAIEIVKQGSASDDACEWKAGKSNDEWQPNCEPNSTYNVFGVAWFKRCPYCGKKIKTVGD